MNRVANAIALGVTLFVTHCDRNSPGERISDELVPKVPESWTSKMALMVSISDDGRLATKVTADGKFVLVDLAAKRVIWNRDVKDRCVKSVRIDPSGEYLAYPLDCGKVVVEEIRTGVRSDYASPAGSKSIHAVAAAAGGHPLAFGTCGRAVYLVRTRGAVPIELQPLGPCVTEYDSVYSLEFSRGVELLAAGWFSWHEKWKVEARNRLHPGWADPGEGNSIGVSIWDVRTGILRAELPGISAGAPAAFSPSADLMVALGDSNRGGLEVWDTSKGKRNLRIEGDTADNPQFVQNGTLLVGLVPHGPSTNPQIRIFSIETGQRVGGLDTASEDIMTRGHSAAGRSDKFLVAHRTGSVDVYRVSADGRQIEKIWEF